MSFKYPKEVSPYVPGVGPRDGSLSLTLVNGGSGYSSIPTIAISAPPQGGTQATATAQIDQGKVIGITVSGGKGYVDAPTVQVTPGPNAPAAERRSPRRSTARSRPRSSRR